MNYTDAWLDIFNKTIIRDLSIMEIDQAIFSYAMATGYLNIY